MSQPQYLEASVRQRLLNLAQSQQENFNFVLTRYGIERLLYRLTQSPSGVDHIPASGFSHASHNSNS
jgi:hypothetical protein